MRVRTSRATQMVRVVIVVAVTLAAFGLALAIPAWGSEVNADASALSCPAPAATSPTYHFGENPLESTAPCAAGPNIAQARYEAIIAGSGVVLFAVGSAMYRRRRRGRPLLGPRTPRPA